MNYLGLAVSVGTEWYGTFLITIMREAAKIVIVAAIAIHKIDFHTADIQQTTTPIIRQMIATDSILLQNPTDNFILIQ